MGDDRLSRLIPLTRRLIKPIVNPTGYDYHLINYYPAADLPHVSFQLFLALFFSLKPSSYLFDCGNNKKTIYISVHKFVKTDCIIKGFVQAGKA